MTIETTTAGHAALRSLRAARSLIVDPDRFLPRGYATNRSGRWCPVGSPEASRFSLFGAVIRSGGKAKELLDLARQHLPDAITTKLAQSDAQLTHDEALGVIDSLVAALAGDRYVPKQSGFVYNPPGVDGRAQAAASPTGDSLEALGQHVNRGQR